MITHTAHPHGTFSWVDLSTVDTDAARAFYGALFGWGIESMPASPGTVYAMCKAEGRVTAAIKTQVERERQLGAPSHWACYFAVDDADAATARVEAAGGSVVLAPMDLRGDVGRKSIVADPTGATAMLWQAKRHIGVGITDQHGTIAWAELVTDDAERAGRFWERVIGWKAAAPAPYAIFRSADRAAAGLRESPPGAPPRWIPYFQVTHCDAAVERALALGAKPLAAAAEFPTGGRCARLADAQGAEFGVLQKA